VSFNLFVSNTPQYKGSGAPAAPPRAGFFGALAGMFGGSQTPNYRRVVQTVVAAPAGGAADPSQVAPAQAPAGPEPVRTRVLTIIIEEYGDEAPEGDASPKASPQ
jgi:hypothetical protein